MRDRENKMEYKNKEMIDIYDNIAKNIIDQGHDKREEFFSFFINALELKTFVEVGVDKAQFSYIILSQTNIDQFFGIDPWIDDFGSNHRPGFFDPNGGNRMLEAQQRLAEFGDRAVLIKDYSITAAKDFADDSIDFCYIDGDHSLEMLLDLYSWIKKVKTGGIMAFDDYKDGPNSGMKDYFGEQLPFQVKTSIDFFCRRYGFKLNTFGKRGYDAWFVKNR